MNFRFPLVLAVFLILAGTRVSAEVDEGLALYQRRSGADFISLERAANALLQKEPGNAAAYYVVGRIALDRGRPVEALRSLRIAHAAATSATFIQLPAPHPHWPSLTLYGVAEALGALDRRNEQLATIETYVEQGWPDYEARNELPRPLVSQKVLALLKLGRTAEAAILVKTRLEDPATTKGVRQDWLWDKLKVLSVTNRNFNESLAVLDEIAKATQPPYSEAFYQWRAATQFRRGDMVGMRADLQLATDPRTWIADNRSNAWRELAMLEFASGKWLDGISSSGRAWSVLGTKGAQVRQDLHKDLRVGSAHAFTIMGCPDLAILMLPDPEEGPPRMGGALYQRSSWMCWAEVCRWLALKNALQMRLPSSEQEGPAAALRSLWAHQLETPAQIQFVSERILSHLASQISAPLKPLDCLALVRNDPLLLISLVELMGAPAFEKLMMEFPLGQDLGRCYQASFDAEVAWHRGNHLNAVTHARQALEHLPQEEHLLRARMWVILSCCESVDPTSSIAAAWRLHPGAFLLAGERLRVQIEASEALSPTVRALDSVVVGSHEGPFLRLRSNDESLHASLWEGANLLSEIEIDGNEPIRQKKLRRWLFCPFSKGLSPEAVALMRGQGATKAKSPER